MKIIRAHPKILKLAIIPFLIDLIAVIGVFIWGSGKISGWVEMALQRAIPDSSGWLWSLAYWPLFIFAWLVFIGALYFLGYLLAIIVASPFNALLAEATLEMKGSIEKREFNFKAWLELTLKMFWVSLAKSLIFLILGLVCLLLTFIPLIGLMASFGLLLIMAFDSADYSFEALGYDLSQRLGFFRSNLFSFAGVASALGLTLLVPGLNFVLFPAAVVGSADLVHRFIPGEKAIREAHVGQRTDS